MLAPAEGPEVAASQAEATLRCVLENTKQMYHSVLKQSALATILLADKPHLFYHLAYS